MQNDCRLCRMWDICCSKQTVKLSTTLVLMSQWVSYSNHTATISTFQGSNQGCTPKHTCNTASSQCNVLKQFQLWKFKCILVQLWTSSNLSKNSEGNLWTNKVLFACVQTEDGQCKHHIMHSVNWRKFGNVLVPMLDLICTTRRSQSKHIGSILYHLITQVEELSPHCALFSEDKQSMQEHTAFQHLPFPSSQARTARNPSCTLDSLGVLLHSFEKGITTTLWLRKP